MLDYSEIRNVVKKTYDIIADQFDPTIYPDHVSSREIVAIDRFISMLPDDTTIIDFGCGAGKHGRYCAEKGANRGFQVCGVDISNKMIEKARECNNNNKYAKIEYLQVEDMCNFKYIKKFGAAISAYSLIHLNKEQAVIALNSFKQHLNNDAYLFLTVYKGKRDGFQKEELAPDYEMYYRDYSSEEFRTIVLDSGYSIIEEYEWNDEDPITGGDPECDAGVLCIIAKYVE